MSELVIQNENEKFILTSLRRVSRRTQIVLALRLDCKIRHTQNEDARKENDFF